MAYSIGLIIDRISGSFEHRILQGVHDFVRQKGGRLWVFAGKRVNSPKSYDLGQDSIYDLPGKASVDGLVVVTGSISAFMTKKQMYDFFRRYKDIPLVSLSIPMAGYPSILIDNSQGIRRIMEHLINVHSYSRIAFVSGPVNNNEAEIRLKTYRQLLSEHGIQYDPALVEYGDFTLRSGIAAAANLVEKKGVPIEAIVASNDDMALGIVLELKRRGVRVPGDIAVTGFDDIDDARYALPPFTTVKQPLYEIGSKGASVMYDILNGYKVEEEIYLNTELVVRQSCGCISYSPLDASRGENIKDFPAAAADGEGSQQILDKALKEIRSFLPAVNEELEKEIILFDRVFFTALETDDETIVMKFLNERLFNEDTDEQIIELWRSIIMIFRKQLTAVTDSYPGMAQLERILYNCWRLLCDSYRFVYGKSTMHHIKELHILRDIVLTLSLSLDMDILMNRIKNEVPKIGISTVVIVMYEGENIPLNRSGVPADTSRLVLAVVDGIRLELSGHNCRFPTSVLLPDYLLENSSTDHLVFLPLNYKENYYGYAAFSLSPLRSFFHESLRDQISVTLDSTRLFQEMHHMSDEIMRQNIELKRLYQFKSDFFSRVSHELRTPMNTINGNIDLLQYGSYDTSEEVLDALDRARLIMESGDWKNTDKNNSERFFKELQNISNHIKSDANLKTYSMSRLRKGLAGIEGPRASELGNLLTTIYDLIKKEEKDTFNAYKKIKQASAAMIGIVDMILNLSSVDSKIQIINKDVVVTDFIARELEKGREYALETSKKEQLIFISRIDKKVPRTLKMDEKWTSRVLAAYIYNAVDFSKKGTITVSVTIKDGRAFFKVTDQGVGIKEEDKKKIFTEFGRSTTGENNRGTGLTLALSRRLIEMQGGRVGFESDYGIGSCFWFSLPM